MHVDSAVYNDCYQDAKKIIFTACHSGKLKLAFTSPDVISTSPKSFLTSRINFTVLLLFKFLKKHHLLVGQVKNRIHQPDSKIHQPRAIGHYLLCPLAAYVCLTVSLWLYTFQIPYYRLLATTARGCEFLAGSCGKFFGYTIFYSANKEQTVS